MSVQRFDTLIAGDDLSGILSANLLSYYNYNVVLLRNSVPADRYSFQGYTLPVSPLILPPLEFGELMSQIKKYLSISQSELEMDSERVDRFQFVTRRLRLDIFQSIDDNAEEFFCEIGCDKKNTKRHLAQSCTLLENIIQLFNRHYPYPPFSFWDDRRIDSRDFRTLLPESSAFDSIEDNRERLAFKTLLAFIQGCSTDSVIAAQHSLIGFIPMNNWLLLSSIEKLKASLIKRLEDRGVLILYNNDGRYHIEKRGFNYYLRDNKQHSSVRVDSVLLSTEYDNLTHLVSERIFSRLKIDRKPYFSRYTTNFVVSSKGIPEIAAKVIFYKENYDSEIAGNSYQITIMKAMRNRAIIKENLVVSVTFDIKPEEYIKKNADMLNERARTILTKVFPFIDGFIVNTSSVLNAESLFDAYMNELSHKGFKPVRYLFLQNDSKDGILFRDMKTGIKNFVFASSSVFAPIGIFGDFMTSVRASEIITKNILGR